MARLIDLNEYLASIPRETLAETFELPELNAILLNNMPNSWSKQAYLRLIACILLNLFMKV